MPLKRIICADPALRKEGREVQLPLSECLKCALTRENGCQYTYEVLKTMYDEVQDRGNNISTTAVLQECMRSVVLERKVAHARSPNEMWAAFKGTMTHAILERTLAPGDWGETAVRCQLPNGEWLSCKPDLVSPNHGILWDYKTAKELPKYGSPWNNHEAQLQVNRFIIDHAEEAYSKTEDEWIPFDSHFGIARPKEWTSLRVVYLTDKGMDTYECTKSVQVPKVSGEGTKRARVADIWDDDQVLNYVMPRYEELDRGLRGYPDYVPPIPEDWVGWTGWKCNGYCPVKKECVRLFVEEGR